VTNLTTAGGNPGGFTITGTLNHFTPNRLLNVEHEFTADLEINIRRHILNHRQKMQRSLKIAADLNGIT